MHTFVSFIHCLSVVHKHDKYMIIYRLDHLNSDVELRNVFVAVEATWSQVKTVRGCLICMFVFDLVDSAALQLFVMKVLLQCKSSP